MVSFSKLIKRDLLILFFSILLIRPVYSQYTNNDYSLVKTTFTRKFDKTIINKYLFSKDPVKVNAALLSIANSDDTLFVKEILKLNFTKYYRNVCFALGELGENITSSNFLLNKLFHDPLTSGQKYSVIETIGKVGDYEAFEKIENLYRNSVVKNIPGLAICIYNFTQRKIIKKSAALKIINQELSSTPTNNQFFFNSIFAVYRLGSSDSMKYILEKDLKNILSVYHINGFGKNDTYNKKSLPYLIGCLRQIKYFPRNDNLFKELLSVNLFEVKIEVCKILAYYPYKNESELSQYLKLLNDPNPNVAREVAASLKELDLSPPLKSHIKGIIASKIKDGNYSPNTKGELLLSYLSFYLSDFSRIQKELQNYVSKNFFYEACAKFQNSGDALNYLVHNYETADKKRKISITKSLINFQQTFYYNKNLNNIFLSALSSHDPALISITADGLDFSLIKQNLDTLSSIIVTQVNLYCNAPDYYESMTSLLSLSEKISKALTAEILNKFKESDIYALKKIAFEKLNLPLSNLLKREGNFDTLWKFAFQYKSAKIITEKGSFTIRFLPQYAPISTGNFCFLAHEKKFDNNIFHRVVPGFVIQGGDPDETGWGGPGYDIVSEFSDLNYSTGTVGMASAGKDTEGSQWFVTTGDFPHLNGRYTIFSKVVNGIKNVFKIDQNDKILNIILMN